MAAPPSSGTVFRLDAANGYTLTTLHDFDGGLGGMYPYASVTADASGNLYGTTYLGGSLRHRHRLRARSREQLRV